MITNLDTYSSEDEKQVFDEATENEDIARVEYDITSYGADYDVEGLVRRLERDNIAIPNFQRDYVWSQPEASRFIESLLLGLPVPGVFLAREAETEQLLVIDGQQRLKSLQFFYRGIFNPDQESTKVFQLKKVQPHFEGKTFDDLDARDKERLNNSILHATIVKQDKPSNDNTSIYHIFERLNTGGRKLAPQQIRNVVYHGDFIDRLGHLNDYEPWRKIFGRKNKLLKDQELILRFLALYFDVDNYKSPMKEFLNMFTLKNKEGEHVDLAFCEDIFKRTIDVAYQALGERAFRLEVALNAAVFDSVMVGIAHRINENSAFSTEKIRSRYRKLIEDETYLQAVSRATANERSVLSRLEMATRAFSDA